MATQTFTGITLNEYQGASISTDDALVDTGALVAATHSWAGTGISMEGIDQTIEVRGTAFGSMLSLSAGNSNSSYCGLNLTVTASGVLTASTEGMFLSGGGNTIDNAGHITGGYGLFVYADSGSTTTTITNSGSIIGHVLNPSNNYHAGIVHVGSETLIVVNTGLIKGVSHAYNAAALASGIDDLTNSGAMIGDVLLGNGADIYDGRLGSVDSPVYGGAGADLLRGGSGAETLYGDSDADEIEGNGGDDRLDGGSGTDTLTGGDGDDVFDVDDAGDTVIEEEGEGDDTVNTAVSFVLSDHVEHLVLTGSADIDGTGNSANNMITGNAGKNALDGGAGADTLIGGDGDDSYVVDDAGDVVTEAENEGSDTIGASLDWTLGDHLETLVLTGSGNFAGTGNGLANEITGNDGANLLSGLDGIDDLVGGKGDDTLDGGTGADTLAGGEGDDTYVVDDAGDGLTEEADQGSDAVEASITWTLGAQFEFLTLTGSDDNDGTGNDLANILTGNSGANALTGMDGGDTLDGGLGADEMSGGDGDDTYIVDDTGDSLSEQSGEGKDLVRSSVTWTLGANFEDLTLTGSGAIDGTGNRLANSLTGNNANNTLSGAGGLDTLNGGGGRDILSGGGDSDELTGGGGNDFLTGGASADLLQGNAGADRFVFESRSDSNAKPVGRDYIADFSHAEGDRIDLSAIDASTKVAGDQAFALIGSGAFTGVAGQLRFVHVSGDTVVLVDVNGDKAADFGVRLEGEINLVRADFML